MQINITLPYLYIPVRMPIVKNTDNTKCWLVSVATGNYWWWENGIATQEDFDHYSQHLKYFTLFLPEQFLRSQVSQTDVILICAPP